MNLQLAIAGVLAVLLGVTHSWIGERLIVQPVLAAEDFPKLRGSRRGMAKIVRFAWHLTSVYFVAMGTLLLYYSRNPKDATVLTVVAVTYFISAVVTLGASRGRHYAWPIFTIIGVIAWISRN
jgi:hypothetical protein